MFMLTGNELNSLSQSCFAHDRHLQLSKIKPETKKQKIQTNQKLQLPLPTILGGSRW